MEDPLEGHKTNLEKCYQHFNSEQNSCGWCGGPVGWASSHAQRGDQFDSWWGT